MELPRGAGRQTRPLVVNHVVEIGPRLAADGVAVLGRHGAGQPIERHHRRGLQAGVLLGRAVVFPDRDDQEREQHRVEHAGVQEYRHQHVVVALGHLPVDQLAYDKDAEHSEQARAADDGDRQKKYDHAAFPRKPRRRQRLRA